MSEPFEPKRKAITLSLRPDTVAELDQLAEMYRITRSAMVTTLTVEAFKAAQLERRKLEPKPPPQPRGYTSVKVEQEKKAQEAERTKRHGATSMTGFCYGDNSQYVAQVSKGHIWWQHAMDTSMQHDEGVMGRTRAEVNAWVAEHPPESYLPDAHSPAQTGGDAPRINRVAEAARADRMQTILLDVYDPVTNEDVMEWASWEELSGEEKYNTANAWIEAHPDPQNPGA